MADSMPFSAQNVLKFFNDNFGLVVLSVGIFVGGFVVGSLWTQNQSLQGGNLAAAPAADPNAAPPEAAPLSDADWAEVQKDFAFKIGNDNAKVKMVEFTDYQCPFCGRHFTDTHAQLMEKYVESGDLQIIMRDQALPFHPNANSAAQAVRCAEEQGGGLAMHDALFANQEQWANLSGDAVVEKYKEYATAAKLNANNVASCVTSEKYKAQVDADGELGMRVGASGTPTFFIEGQPLVGAQPLSAFEAAIDAQL